MSMPKKSLLACVSAAALVASIGFVQAQDAESLGSPYVADSERSVYGLNDVQTQSHDQPAMPNDSTGNTVVVGDSAYAASAESGSVPPADKSPGFKPNTGIDGTPCIPEGSAGQRSGVYDPATSTCQTVTVQTPAPMAEVAPAPVEPAPAPVAATTPPAANNMVVSSAPETRVDLSPPSDPLYNLPQGERAPRPDRN